METITKLSDLAKAVTITAKRGEAVLAWDKRDKWQKGAIDWRVTLKYQNRRYSFDFWQGMSIDGAPSVESVLNCLISDTESATGSFNDFCANLGYSEDSIKAKRIYDACHRQDKRLKRLFGSDYTMFINAERD